MGEAIVRHERGDKWDVQSAGTEPKGVHPMSIKALEEVGIDTAGLKSKHVSAFLGIEFDLVVTLCDQAAESCPFFPGAKRLLHLGFEDPAAASGPEKIVLNKFRRVRDEIKKNLIELLDEF